MISNSNQSIYLSKGHCLILSLLFEDKFGDFPRFIAKYYQSSFLDRDSFSLSWSNEEIAVLGTFIRIPDCLSHNFDRTLIYFSGLHEVLYVTATTHSFQNKSGVSQDFSLDVVHGLGCRLKHFPFSIRNKHRVMN